MVDGVIHFRLCPRADFFVRGLAGRTHHNEGVHERIVYRTLKPMLLVQRAVVFGIRYGPFGVALAEMSAPGAVRHHRRCLEFLTVQYHARMARNVERTKPWRHRKSESVDIRCGGADNVAWFID